MPRTRPALDYALLGLLARGPASGYDLRKIFQTTALGRYSDSPGSIYPALARLERQGLIDGRTEQSGHRRRVFHLTMRGRHAMTEWIEQPIAVDDLLRDAAIVDLRLAFMSDAAPGQLEGFLGQYARAAAEYVKRLEAGRDEFENAISRSAALAFELGITLARARASWVRTTASAEQAA
ncbi:MAG TPA: PadR family transcriptional regulator [Gemmatimonadaceae bacterium]|jgi:DNA-binding PadR family transcriptional regulator|nr:PadR family transcriptional regulator [Gemmatimonadaceae bacterium]